MTHFNRSILLIRQAADTKKTIKGQKSALSGRNSQWAVGTKTGKSLKQLGVSGKPSGWTRHLGGLVTAAESR
jgi:hypothetical protein